MRRRGELLERGFAHCLETGAMRRVHLRGRANILKRYLIHVAAFNLSLVMRQIFGVGTPRGLQGRLDAILEVFGHLVLVLARIAAVDRDRLDGPTLFPTRIAPTVAA